MTWAMRIIIDGRLADEVIIDESYGASTPEHLENLDKWDERHTEEAEARREEDAFDPFTPEDLAELEGHQLLRDDEGWWHLLERAAAKGLEELNFYVTELITDQLSVTGPHVIVARRTARVELLRDGVMIALAQDSPAAGYQLFWIDLDPTREPTYTVETRETSAEEEERVVEEFRGELDEWRDR